MTLLFFFPFYWAMSQGLRNPIDTSPVSGLGVPWLSFEPTIDNWVTQLSSPESRRALANSTVVSVSAAVLALALGTPAAYALARFRFRWIPNKDITIWFLSQRVLPPSRP